MNAPQPAGLSPLRAPVDEALLAGHTFLGEPLVLLVCALLRLQFGAEHNGMMDVTATWTSEEAEAFTRAMERVEGPVPKDGRTVGQRDYDRFVATARAVLLAWAELQESQRPAG